MGKLACSIGMLSMICSALLCGACAGGGAAGALIAEADGAGAAATQYAAGSIVIHGASGITLEVLPESFLGAEPQGEFALVVTALPGGGAEVRVRGERLAGLRAFYARLHCPDGFALDEAAAGSGLGTPDEVLSLCHGAGNAVDLGAVLQHCDKRSGVSGAAELARVTLRRSAADAVRTASFVPARTADHPVLYVNCTTKRIEWEHRLRGDYNQDGVANMADLTPLAVHWGEAGVEHADEVDRFVLDSIQEVLDTSNDERLGLPDLTALGINYGAKVEGWNLYRSLTPATEFPDVDLDAPGGNGAAPSKIERFAYRAFPVLAEGNPARERLRFGIGLPLLTGNMAYWVRPVEAGAEGAPSNWSPYDSGLEVSGRIDPESYFGLGTGTLEFEFRTLGADLVDGVLWARDVDALRALSTHVHFAGTEFDTLPFPEGLTLVDGAGASAKYKYYYEIPNTAYAALDDNYDGALPGMSGTFPAWRVRLARLPQTGQTTPRVLGPQVILPLRSEISYDAPNKQLRWYYTGAGDLNQNGFVFMSDLLLVNYYWGSVGPFGIESFLTMVDGSSNGGIGVDDLTAPAVNHIRAISGYNIYAALDPAVAPVDTNIAGDPGIAPVAYVSFLNAGGDTATDRLSFGYHFYGVAPGTYLWVQPEFMGEIGNVMKGDYVQAP